MPRAGGLAAAPDAPGARQWEETEGLFSAEQTRLSCLRGSSGSTALAPEHRDALLCPFFPLLLLGGPPNRDGERWPLSGSLSNPGVLGMAGSGVPWVLTPWGYFPHRFFLPLLVFSPPSTSGKRCLRCATQLKAFGEGELAGGCPCSILSCHCVLLCLPGARHDIPL